MLESDMQMMREKGRIKFNKFDSFVFMGLETRKPFAVAYSILVYTI